MLKSIIMEEEERINNKKLLYTYLPESNEHNLLIKDKIITISHKTEQEYNSDFNLIINDIYTINFINNNIFKCSIKEDQYGFKVNITYNNIKCGEDRRRVGIVIYESKAKEIIINIGLQPNSDVLRSFLIFLNNFIDHYMFKILYVNE
ncbi:Hypothetical protein ORPV_869 [Orpheovirus IHUMI-LCC2]|uniref:Uncharacterized protein n=1 Tax=Orpheovirus IHUMI-LCC2 TaxID=2023057 RepID=A0A2I2L5G1_9VIRU|nr:Hypothetical protein ORPV_869 [Orpheovirus IHUMI-LCC2]SNW62773.1 Hypothetical protein ORPV_869 [Orpheovirus IHUMI-LCC2]